MARWKKIWFYINPYNVQNVLFDVGENQKNGGKTKELLR